ncbi:hypothetical protein M404DRAFT_463308 [Pisolithus tinctorius Marx 270]|uniref:Uncharacterized protein n=1 Tax=Pisolithus tinctorius Marx 270 TaxID=870435 RepID=A0A0C3PXG2_PISTI|nr:hypothetical protein M404DRAFT_463308 [Pisolithus tinctorius Marx 270]
MLHTNCHTRWRTSLACIWHPFIPDWRPVLKCTVRILGSRRIHMHTRGLFVTTERQQFFFPQRNVTNHELSSPGRGARPDRMCLPAGCSTTCIHSTTKYAVNRSIYTREFLCSACLQRKSNV